MLPIRRSPARASSQSVRTTFTPAAARPRDRASNLVAGRRPFVEEPFVDAVTVAARARARAPAPTSPLLSTVAVAVRDVTIR